MTTAKICVSTPMRNIKNQIIDDKLANIENELYGFHTTNAAERVEIVSIYGIKYFLSETASTQNPVLTKQGERRLYLKMKDSLIKILGYQQNNEHRSYKSYRLLKRKDGVKPFNRKVIEKKSRNDE